MYICFCTMSWLFGTRITPREKLKRINRSLRKCMRDLEREHTRMERENKKIIQQIKQAGKNGNIEDAKHSAKDVIRVRSYIRRFPFTKSKIQVVLLQIQDMKLGDDMTEAMRSIVDINKQIRLPDIQDIIMEFKEQLGITEEEEELNDFSDDVDNSDEDEPLKFLVPTDTIPGGLSEVGRQQESGDAISEVELEARLERLKS